MNSAPGAAAAAAPTSPNSVSDTAAPFSSMVSTISARAAASAEVSAIAATSLSAAALARVRFQTTTLKPAAARLRAIGAPMIPVPNTATDPVMPPLPISSSTGASTPPPRLWRHGSVSRAWRL